MNLTRAPNGYEVQDQDRIRQDLMRADEDNFKRGRDIESGGARIIGTSPNGSRWALVFNDDGTLTLESAD